MLWDIRAVHNYFWLWPSPPPPPPCSLLPCLVFSSVGYVCVWLWWGRGKGGSLLWGATGWPDHGWTSQFSIEAFQRVFAEKPTPFGCFRACYLGFDWSSWIVLIKSEILITTRMIWPVSSDKWKVPLSRVKLLIILLWSAQQLPSIVWPAFLIKICYSSPHYSDIYSYNYKYPWRCWRAGGFNLHRQGQAITHSVLETRSKRKWSLSYWRESWEYHQSSQGYYDEDHCHYSRERSRW